MSKGTSYLLGFAILAIVVFSCTARLPGQTPPHDEEEMISLVDQTGSRTKAINPILYEHVSGNNNVFGIRYGVTTLSSSASLLFGRKFGTDRLVFVPHAGVSLGDMNGVSVGGEFGFETESYSFMSMVEYTRLLHAAQQTASFTDRYASADLYRMLGVLNIGASGTAWDDPSAGKMVLLYGPSAMLKIEPDFINEVLGVKDFAVWTKVARNTFGSARNTEYRSTFALGVSFTE
jgi:hypothetical protein